MQDKPLVSVIITTFERPDNLQRAIKSVLNQTYDNIEIIVVDDNGLGSIYQQETRKVIREYMDHFPIKYIVHTEHINGSAARNTGLKNSKGEFIAFLDDDDEFVPNKIELQISKLLSKPEEYGACTCNSMIHHSLSSRVTKLKNEELLCQEFMLENRAFNTSSVVFRHVVLKQLDGFDDSFLRYQDWELFIRFFRKYKMCLVETPYLVVRYHTPNIIAKEPMVAIEYLEKFHAMFKSDIDKMPICDKVYQTQYEWLALSLLSNHCKAKGLHYASMAFRYGTPSMMTILKYLYNLLK